MRLRNVLWTVAVGAGMGAAAYGVSCVDNSTPDTTCPAYCKNIESTCEGGLAQYPDDTTCQRICGAMAPGEAGTAGGDTIACRNFFVNSVADDLPQNVPNDCFRGGPTSSACPTSCQSFCDLTMSLCNGLNGFAGSADCLAACATWPVGAMGMSAFNGPLIPTTGNNLQCRTYHLELSQKGDTPMQLQSNMMVHCPHTGANSALCKDPDGGVMDAASDAPSD